MAFQTQIALLFNQCEWLTEAYGRKQRIKQEVGPILALKLTNCNSFGWPHGFEIKLSELNLRSTRQIEKKVF